MSFLSYIINGISLGSVYAIIALGYTMVYGIAKMLNFAHGDVIMVGGFVAFTAMNSAGLPPLVAVLLSMLVCTVLGVVIERVAYKPLRMASPLAVLITAIGVSYFLQNLALLIFGADTKTFQSVISFEGISLAGGQLKISGVTLVTILASYFLQNLALLIFGADTKTFQSVISFEGISLAGGQLKISGVTLVTILACIIIVVGLTLFIRRTKAGQAMLAVSEDRGAAQLMGINVNGTIALTFAIGSALAAVAGVLLCSAYPSLNPYTGAMPGIKAFVAAVFGGIGSIPGAMLGGILLGVIEILAKAYISSQLADAIVFAVLIVVLLVKPTGIFGKKIQEKV